MGEFLGFMYLLVHVPLFLSPYGASAWKDFLKNSDDPNQKKHTYLLKWSCATLLYIAFDAAFILPSVKNLYGFQALWFPASLFFLKIVTLIRLVRFRYDGT